MSTALSSLRDVASLREAIAAGHPVEYVFFWGHTRKDAASIGKECLSQWYPAPFIVDGVSYPTAEHFMMVGKARLFGDGEIEARILAAEQPNQAKRLGRQIRGFDDAKWTEARFGLIVAGNVAKFSQNARLREFLLGTADRVLVEASPEDKIWGIGLAADDPRASDPSAWLGLNLLGFALMEARSLVSAQASGPQKGHS
jgi:ribA/ribD-fused uncharacterized protein